MNCVCITSHGYLDLVPAFRFLWDKYTGLPIITIVTGERDKWCEEVRSALQALNNEPILMVLEDYWLFAPMDNGHLNRLLAEVEQGAQKADLQGQVRYWEHKIESSGILVATQNARYRTSLQASIWNKDFLLRKLTCGKNPWSFELQDNDYDGARIVGMDTPTLFYANIVYKGKVMDYEVARIRPEDWEALKASGVVPKRVIEQRSTT